MYKNLFKFPTEQGGSDSTDQNDQKSSQENVNNPNEENTQSTKETKHAEKTYSKEEVESLIEGRLAKAKRSWEKEQADRQSEADKLAKMNEDQKRSYEMDKREKELKKREVEIAKRELQSKAKEILSQKNLPSELANLLDYSSAEACDASIESVEAAFNKAVETDVESKLKGGQPPKKAPNTATITKEAIENMSAAEINANWSQVKDYLASKK